MAFFWALPAHQSQMSLDSCSWSASSYYEMGSTKTGTNDAVLSAMWQGLPSVGVLTGDVIYAVFKRHQDERHEQEIRQMAENSSAAHMGSSQEQQASVVLHGDEIRAALDAVTGFIAQAEKAGSDNDAIRRAKHLAIKLEEALR